MRECREDIKIRREENILLIREIKCLKERIERLKFIEEKLENNERHKRKNNIIIEELKLKNRKDRDSEVEKFIINDYLNIEVKTKKCTEIDYEKQKQIEISKERNNVH